MQANPPPPSKPLEKIPEPAATSSRAADEEEGSENGEPEKQDESKGLSESVTSHPPSLRLSCIPLSSEGKSFSKQSV